MCGGSDTKANNGDAYAQDDVITSLLSTVSLAKPARLSMEHAYRWSELRAKR